MNSIKNDPRFQELALDHQPVSRQAILHNLYSLPNLTIKRVDGYFVLSTGGGIRKPLLVTSSAETLVALACAYTEAVLAEGQEKRQRRSLDRAASQTLLNSLLKKA